MTEQSSIPIIQLWNHLVVPIQGDVSDEQAAVLRSHVLAAIQRTGAAGLVVDVSGVTMIDSHLCSLLTRIARGAALMGTRSVISGMGPDIVMTLVSMGVELENVHTTLSLEEALSWLGVRVVIDDKRLDEMAAADTNDFDEGLGDETDDALGAPRQQGSFTNSTGTAKWLMQK